MSKQIIRPGAPVRGVRAIANGRAVPVEIVRHNEHEDAAEREAQAYAKGFADGKKTGIELAHQEMGEMYRQLGALVSQLIAEQQHLLRQAEPTLINVVMAVVRRVIRRELAGDSEYAATMVREALRYVHDSTKVVVRMHPDDAALLRDKVGELTAGAQGLEQLELKEDPHLAPGGCLVETDLGTIDARLEAQLEEIAHELEEALIGQS
ncbi:MAG: FliH/SctL family protein [Candidatus Oleimicrobiaceae bacterium]